MYDVHATADAKTAPKSLLDTFAKINTKHHYNTPLSTKECFSVKFSGPEKIINSLTRIAVFIYCANFASLTERKRITRNYRTLNVYLNSASSEGMAKIKTAYFS